MKRLAFLGFTIATLIAPIQVQAQTGCIRFPQPPNHEAELRYLLSHPGAVVCPSAQPDPAGTATILEKSEGPCNRWRAPTLLPERSRLLIEWQGSFFDRRGHQNFPTVTKSPTAAAPDFCNTLPRFDF